MLTKTKQARDWFDDLTSPVARLGEAERAVVIEQWRARLFERLTNLMMEQMGEMNRADVASSRLMLDL